jgi:hypothetical protein
MTEQATDPRAEVPPAQAMRRFAGKAVLIAVFGFAVGAGATYAFSPLAAHLGLIQAQPAITVQPTRDIPVPKPDTSPDPEQTDTNETSTPVTPPVAVPPAPPTEAEVRALDDQACTEVFTYISVEDHSRTADAGADFFESQAEAAGSQDLTDLLLVVSAQTRSGDYSDASAFDRLLNFCL